MKIIDFTIVRRPNNWWKFLSKKFYYISFLKMISWSTYHNIDFNLHNQMRTSGFDISSNPFCFRILPTNTVRMSWNSLNFELNRRILHNSVENLIIAVNSLSIISFENDRTTSSTLNALTNVEWISCIHGIFS